MLDGGGEGEEGVGELGGRGVGVKGIGEGGAGTVWIGSAARRVGKGSEVIAAAGWQALKSSDVSSTVKNKRTKKLYSPRTGSSLD